MSSSQRKSSQSQHGHRNPTEGIHGLSTSSSSSHQRSTPTPHLNESLESSGLTGSSAQPLNLDPLNSPAAGYVFSMSSAVSLDPNKTSSNRSEGGDGFSSLTPRANIRRKSSEYVEMASRDRYGIGKHASGAGARHLDSVTRGPLKKASYVEEIEIERMGGSRPPMQRFQGNFRKSTKSLMMRHRQNHQVALTRTI